MIPEKKVRIFDHVKTCEDIAEKHGVDFKTVHFITRAFFGSFGVIYFIKRFYVINIPGIFKIKPTTGTFKVFISSRIRMKLAAYRWKDRTRWDRPTDY